MQKLLQSKKGSTLPIVLTVLVVVIIFSVTALTIGSASMKQTQNQELRLQAYYLARSGAHAVASHIIKKADQSTEAQMNTFIDNLVAAGTSDAFKLDDSDEGDIRVTVTEDPSNGLLVSSTAAIGGISKTVSVGIGVTKKESTGMVIDKMVYASGGLILNNHTKIDGNVAVQGTLGIDNNCEITGEITYMTATPSYPELVYPSLPLAPTSEVNSKLEIKNRSIDINQSKRYKSGISIENKGIFNINNNSGSTAMTLYIDNDLTIANGGKMVFNLGDQNINIVANKLSSTGNFVINRASGKKGVVNLFIKQDGNLDIQGGTINYPDSGKPDSKLLNIYHLGQNTALKGSKLSAMLYIKRGNLNFDNNFIFDGSILFEGDGVTLGNNSVFTNTLLYAPKANVNGQNNVSFQGTIISGKQISLSHGIYKFTEVSFPLPNDSGSGSTETETTYTIGQWQ